MARSSSGLGRLVLIQEIMGSTPIRAALIYTSAFAKRAPLKSMKIKIIIFLILISLLGSGCILKQSDDYKNDYKKIIFKADSRDVAIEVEVAKTPEEISRGLMWREYLDEYSGMLFIFQGEAPRNFWMKNTLINLDIIFISKDKKIISIAENVIPCSDYTTECPLYKSEAPAQYVVEVNGGFCKEHNIEKGDEVELEI